MRHSRISRMVTGGIAVALSSSVLAGCGSVDDDRTASHGSQLLAATNAYAFYDGVSWDAQRDAHNPLGGTTMVRKRDGSYLVTFAGMQSAIGNSQVTAVGDGNARCSPPIEPDSSTTKITSAVGAACAGTLKPSIIANAKDSPIPTR